MSKGPIPGNDKEDEHEKASRGAERRTGDDRRQSERRATRDDRRSGLGFRPEPDRRYTDAAKKPDTRRKGCDRRKT